MRPLHPSVTLAEFAQMVAEDLRVTTAATHARANSIQAEALALRSWEHPNFGKPDHQPAVDTGIRELNEESMVLGRELLRLRNLVDLLNPYISQITGVPG